MVVGGSGGGGGGSSAAAAAAVAVAVVVAVTVVMSFKQSQGPIPSSPLSLYGLHLLRVLEPFKVLPLTERPIAQKLCLWGIFHIQVKTYISLLHECKLTVCTGVCSHMHAPTHTHTSIQNLGMITRLLSYYR